MDRGFGAAVTLAIGAAVGYVAGRWTDGCRGGYPGGYPGGYAPGYCAPGYGGYGPGYGPGYYTGDRPCHEDKQDERIACLQAQVAAIGVSDKKNEEIDALRYRLGREITNGDIFKATCLKPDGHVQLRMSQVGSPYRDEPLYVNTHVHHSRKDGWCDQGDWFGNCGNY